MHSFLQSLHVVACVWWCVFGLWTSGFLWDLPHISHGAPYNPTFFSGTIEGTGTNSHLGMPSSRKTVACHGNLTRR